MGEVRVRARVRTRGEARSGDETYSAAYISPFISLHLPISPLYLPTRRTARPTP